MRALGLVPINEELDNVVIAFLLAPHYLGGGGMGDLVIQCVQDSVITILTGLQHDLVAVRANYENLSQGETTIASSASGLRVPTESNFQSE